MKLTSINWAVRINSIDNENLFARFIVAQKIILKKILTCNPKISNLPIVYNNFFKCIATIGFNFVV